MGRFKTLEERMAKKLRKRNEAKDPDKMTAKDWRAIHRDKRAVKVMKHLDRIPKHAPKKIG